MMVRGSRASKSVVVCCVCGVCVCVCDVVFFVGGGGVVLSRRRRLLVVCGVEALRLRRGRKKIKLKINKIKCVV